MQSLFFGHGHGIMNRWIRMVTDGCRKAGEHEREQRRTERSGRNPGEGSV